MNFDRAVILHGKPKPERFKDPRFDPSEANWLGWLSEELSKEGIVSVSPRLERAYDHNDFQRWVEQIREKTAFAQGKNGTSGSKHRKGSALKQKDRVALIGHSAAAAVYLRWLSGTRSSDGFFSGSSGTMCVRPDALILVAPWLGLDPKYGSLSKVEIDPGLSERIGTIKLVHCNQDVDGGVPESIERIMDTLKLGDDSLIELNGYGHFMTDNKMDPDYDLGNGLMGSTFPELINILERI